LAILPWRSIHCFNHTVVGLSCDLSIIFVSHHPGLAQPTIACIINLMENSPSANAERPDPEVQTGRALRRLRLSRGWSQEAVARRMRAYGYDFHQTMIAKIEAAQRPLRVRELGDFAALYDVQVRNLIYPPNDSLAEVDREIAEVEARRDQAKQRASAAAAELDEARAVLADAQAAYDAYSREVAMLEERLSFLQKEQEEFVVWDGEEPSPAAALKVAIVPFGSR
jgi:transcriptional regulator with XRE-family HTH domain